MELEHDVQDVPRHEIIRCLIHQIFPLQMLNAFDIIEFVLLCILHKVEYVLILRQHILPNVDDPRHQLVLLEVRVPFGGTD